MACATSWRASEHGADFPTRRADRLRPDRRLDRARRAGPGARQRNRHHRALGEDPRARRRTRHRRSRAGEQCGSRAGRRPRDPLHPGRRLRSGRAGDRALPESRRDRFRRRLGQGRHRPGNGAASAAERSFRSGPSGRRHRTFGPRFRLRRTLHQSLVHSHASRGRRSRGRRNAARVLGRHSAPGSRS